MALTPISPISRQRKRSCDFKLLYVEDEDSNWEIAQLGLRDKYDLERARNAREAFDLLRIHKFDAVLMDIQLMDSEFNGIEITQIMRNRFDGELPHYAQSLELSDVPVIFVTAFKETYSREALELAGGNELIPKPVDFIRLSLAISRLVAREISGKTFE
jgi:CheY-like chemotaxis protein